jgi:hypothetical protein
MLMSGRCLNVRLFTAGFPEGITPASPIDSKPIIPFDTCLRLEFEFPQWRAAVGLCGSFDFPDDVQLRHRNSFLWLYIRTYEGAAGYSILHEFSSPSEKISLRAWSS